MTSIVVVDASLAVKWLVKEEYSDSATALARAWNRGLTQLATPYLMLAEATNVLHRRVVRGELTVGSAVGLLEYLLSLGIELHETAGLRSRALELASQLNQPKSTT